MIDDATGPAADEGGDAPCWAHLVDDHLAPTPAVLARLVHDLAEAVVLGTSLDVIIPERFRERHWAGYRSVMASGHTEYGSKLLEVPGMHRDGTRLSLAFTVTLMTDAASGACTGVAAVVRDDTAAWQQRREARAELDALRAEVADLRDAAAPSS
jgi:hypothetical protein